MYKILIAEDERDILKLIEFTLQYGGFEAISTSNGTDAWEMTKQKLPHLVLLDVRMPGMSGYEVCTQIKSTQQTKHIPVVFLSAKGQDSEIKTGFESGAIDYILKPFAPDQLLNRLVEVIDNHPDIGRGDPL
jgi:two-component system alkaline phosphatase synthesis response regulator PhoP